MNSEIFSCLEFHTVDEKRRAEVGDDDGVMVTFCFFFEIWVFLSPVESLSVSTTNVNLFQLLKEQEEKDEEDMAEKIKASFKKSAAEKALA